MRQANSLCINSVIKYKLADQLFLLARGFNNYIGFTKHVAWSSGSIKGESTTCKSTILLTWQSFDY